MSRPRWWRLGARGAAPPAGSGPKAALLHRAARRGLPVPEACVIPEESLEEALARGLVTRRTDHEGALALRDAEALAAFLALPALGPRVALRSAFSLEDGREESLAGRFETRLGVNPDEPAELAAALIACWSSARRAGGPCRRDLLVMRMVDARFAGVAFSEREHEDELVAWVEGLAEELVAGRVAGASLELPRLRALERAGGPRFEGLPGFAPRLAALLRSLRRALGEGEWDVEWADDGARCWLLQARPVTAPTRRNELFTQANHREILPDPPSPLMSGLIAEAAPELFDYYRRFDARLPRSRPFIEVLHGRPLINLSLLCDMAHLWGLPTRLITGSIGTRVERERGLAPARLLRSLPVLARLGLDQLRAPARSRRVARELIARAEAAGPAAAEQLDALREVYVRLVREMFALTAAMSGPMALARRLGVLEALAARSRSVTGELGEALEELRRLAREEPGAGEALRRRRLPASPRFEAAFARFIERFGHRGVYESDVARPRYAELSGALLERLGHTSEAAGGEPRAERPRAPRRARLLAPLFARAAAATRAREELRHEAMRAFLVIRRGLLARGEALLAKGALPDAEAIFLLSPEEARRLDAGARYGVRFFEERRQRLEALAMRPLPDVLRRFDPLAPERGGRGPERELSGIGLVEGVVEGRAVVLRNPDESLPADWGDEPAILVAPALDPGWVPLFGLFDAVVAETGGDLSHASIVLREQGRVAVTNARGALSLVGEGAWLRVDGGRGLVELLEEAPARARRAS